MGMSFKGAPDDSKEARFAKLSDEVFEAIQPHGGYVTKDSNGIFLMAFNDPDSALGFSVDLGAKVTDLMFTAGVHIGTPTNIAPNKSSGRADYLGPPVNATARIMSLAADKKDVIGGDNTVL